MQQSWCLHLARSIIAYDKGRSLSRWHLTQSNDVYSKAARSENYRCRSAFKLLQIHEAFGIFKQKEKIVDLGACPGSWSQVAVKHAKPNGNFTQVLSVDILDFKPIVGVHKLSKVSIEDSTTISDVMKELWGQEGRPHLVLSDMLHNVSGESLYDHINSIKLCSLVLKFCLNHLENKGTVVMKVLSGPHQEKFKILLQKYFQKVYVFKPDASKNSSREMYFIAINFRRKLVDNDSSSDQSNDLSEELR